MISYFSVNARSALVLVEMPHDNLYVKTHAGVFCILDTLVVFFSKVHPACHNIASGIQPGNDSKKTDNHAADCSKTVCWCVK